MAKCTDRPAMTIAVDMEHKATKTIKQTIAKGVVNFIFTLSLLAVTIIVF